MPRFINADIVEHHLQELIEKYENRMPDWSPNDNLTSGKDTALKYGYIADGIEKALEIIQSAETNCWDESTVHNWYIDSVSENDSPVWTDDHISELYNDFWLIKKEMEE